MGSNNTVGRMSMTKLDGSCWKFTWISQCSCRGSHDSGYQGVGLTERWLCNMQPFNSNPVQCRVVQHDDSISVEREALEGQQGVVRLNNYIAGLILVGEHTAKQGVE